MVVSLAMTPPMFVDRQLLAKAKVWRHAAK